VDLNDGVVTVAQGRSITWLHVPRLRMTLRGRHELDEMIEALMAAREELMEGATNVSVS
jgi:hypothetical protein